ncbi:MAG: hypothetical protein FJ045_00720, partial [Crenarchaeota archaeon]|nr:hypothetical protein [Thermoproteota archaeon]
MFFQADANRTQAKPLVIVGKLINKDGSPKVGETVIGCLMKADKLTTYEVAYKEGQVTNPKAKTAKDASFQIRIDRAALKGYSFVAVGL